MTAQALLDATEKSLFRGHSSRLSRATALAISATRCSAYVEARGYSVVRDFVGHGVGAKLHEDPSVPNYGTPGRGVRLYARHGHRHRAHDQHGQARR